VAEELAGRTAWVTGGAGGIGAAIVRRLSERGAALGVLDVQEGEAPPGPLVHCDVSDAASVAAAADELERAVGPADIVVNCAGVSARSAVVDMTEELWHHVLSVNLTGPFLVTRRVLPGMLARRFGRVVNISSGSAVRVTEGTAAYSASKAGLIAFTKAVATEGAAGGVTANVVAPGIVDTPMTRRAWPTDEEMTAMATTSAIANPMRTILVPDDIAHAVCFLASPGAGHITGQTIHVNGGSFMA